MFDEHAGHSSVISKSTFLLQTNVFALDDTSPRQQGDKRITQKWLSEISKLFSHEEEH